MLKVFGPSKIIFTKAQVPMYSRSMGDTDKFKTAISDVREAAVEAANVQRYGKLEPMQPCRSPIRSSKVFVL